MTAKLTHHSSGDNVAGNKYVENKFSTSENLTDKVNSKIQSLEDFNKLDFESDDIISVFKEVFSEIIIEEQKKCHDIVPISALRNRFETYVNDNIFTKIVSELSRDRKLLVQDVQVCYVPKDLNYRITL